MALPWLIGAAAVAATTAVVAALSEDSSSGSTSYSDNEAEERRKAEREREQRQRIEKIEALKASYNERLEFDLKKLTRLLRTIALVDNVERSDMSVEDLPSLELNYEYSCKNLLTQNIVQHKRTFDRFHSNVDFFEKLSTAYIEPKEEVVQISDAIDSLEKQIKKIDVLINKLN